MTIYEDYFNFIAENSSSIDEINEHSPILSYYIKDILASMDKVYRIYIRGEEIETELEELFTVGFYYMEEFLQDYKYILENSLNNDLELLKKYEGIIYYYFQFQDLRAYLEAEELMNDERTKNMEDADLTIDDCLNDKADYNEEVENYLQSIYNLVSPGDEYMPTYIIFSELLNLLNEMKID